MTKKQKKMLWRIIATAVIILVIKLFSIGGIAGTLLYLAAYGIIGYDILRKAGKGIVRGQVFDENFLMAVATVGAIGLAFYEKSGDFLEAVAVMLFYQIGELFQSYAVGKSRRSITALMDIRPDYANIEQDGQLTQVDPGEVPVGAVIVVQPGAKVPLDGVVLEGSSTLNTAALTGESLPRDVTDGDEIVSGCINMTGVLKIRTTKAFGESTVSKILELVENSSSHKSKSENFISKFARVYTPAVCAAALALAVLPPVVRLLAGLDGDWGTWLYRALSFLVVSCPCALVISIPLSFFAGLGGASHQGGGVRQDRHPDPGRVRRHRRASQFTAPGESAGIRRSGRVRLLPPHQPQPSAGLWRSYRPRPGHGYPGIQRQRRGGQGGRCHRGRGQR